MTIELRSYPWYLYPVVVAEHYTHLVVLSRILSQYRERAIDRLRRVPSVGEIIDIEFLDPLGMEDWELAEKADIDEEVLLDVCLGRTDLIPEIAEKLAVALGTTPEFWMESQTHYREYAKGVGQ